MQYYNTKPIRTTNRNARDYVRNGVPFRNSNGQLFGRWETPDLFVVYSYGEHWPLFLWAGRTDTWYANEEKYSSTTSRHYTYAHPHKDTAQAASLQRMKQIINAYQSAHRHVTLAAKQAAALTEVQSTLGLAA
jgi:hypothetical protein